MLLAGCAHPPEPVKPQPHLAKIRAAGKLRVVTRNAGTSYYIGQHGPVGPDYELARRFASDLGVELEMYTVNSLGALFEELRSGRADLAAGHISATPAREAAMRFGPPYQYIAQTVVYRADLPRPKKPADLVGRRIGILADSSYVETLTELRATLPGLEWEEVPGNAIDTLLARIADGTLDVTIADSSAVELLRSNYPEVAVAFDLKRDEPIAWAFRREDDDSLYHEAMSYFRRLDESGEIDALLRRYYEPDSRVAHLSARDFVRHIETRLPAYRELFEEVAAETGVEWRLLAAIAYQESRWDPHAVSYTGVRGMMMLTRATAKELGVQDREDARQSIEGGARYFLAVKAKIPARIPEPDRTFLALAAYNVGFGHLEDARILTQTHGKNPDRWDDVREYLPLLSDDRWYPNLKRGYARGREPVRFVRNIRTYYDTLLWLAPEDDSIRVQQADYVRPAPTLAQATS